MSEDCDVFVDASVLIPASISGQLDKKAGVEHVHYPWCHGLLTSICVLHENEVHIGYLPPTAEKESRREIEHAVKTTVTRFWKKVAVSKEEQERQADAVETFYTQTLDKLDAFIYILRRMPVSSLKRKKVIEELRNQFTKLDDRYNALVKYYSSNVKLSKGLHFPEQDSYKPGIEVSDLEILADTIIFHRTRKKQTFLAAIDNDMTSDWSMKMLEDEFGINVRKPEYIVQRLTKRYRQILKNR
jgi:hypothetical protein